MYSSKLVSSETKYLRICNAWFQELNAYRVMLQTLFNYDWVNVPLVYTQVRLISQFINNFLTSKVGFVLVVSLRTNTQVLLVRN